MSASLALPATALAAGSGITIDTLDASGYPTVKASVSVFTPAGAPALGLDAASFQVSDDGSAVSELRSNPAVNPRLPIASVMLLDTSASMADGTLDLAKTVATTFIQTLQPGDTASVVTFGPAAQVAQQPTGDHAALTAAVGQLKPGGSTRLYEGLLDVAAKLDAAAPHRRLILLVSDGQDSASKVSEVALLNDLQRIGVPVASVGIGPNVSHDVLDRVGAVTGGSMIYPTGADATLRAFITSIEDKQRWQYTLSWQSRPPGNGQRHTLSIASTAAAGASADAQFTSPVISPEPSLPQAPAPAVPTAVPAPPSPRPAPLDSSYLIAMLVAVVLAGGLIWLLAWHARPPRPVAEPEPADQDPNITEDILPVAPAMSAFAPARAPDEPITEVPLDLHPLLGAGSLPSAGPQASAPTAGPPPRDRDLAAALRGGG